MLYKNFLKRPIDLAVSLLALILLSPIFFLITILLAATNKGKPFFLQSRPGKDEKIFKVIKFKTMSNKRDSDGKLLPDNMRLNKLGIFIRRSSLDEIPQLINVLKGDMSLIGPRPLLVEYLSLYNEKQKKRHKVRPGITGWAQVNGRNSIIWDKKFEYDTWYVENVSFLLDLKICYLTLKKVLISEGISSNSSMTMEKFTGNI